MLLGLRFKKLSHNLTAIWRQIALLAHELHDKRMDTVDTGVYSDKLWCDERAEVLAEIEAL